MTLAVTESVVAELNFTADCDAPPVRSERLVLTEDYHIGHLKVHFFLGDNWMRDAFANEIPASE